MAGSDVFVITKSLAYRGGVGRSFVIIIFFSLVSMHTQQKPDSVWE